MYLFLLICLVGFAVLAILLRDLLKAAISLAVASIFLAIIFFGMGAPYVGVFEISVVAGLITVLFVSTVALTKGEGDVRESKIPTIIFPIFFIIFIIIDIIIMKKLLGQLPAMRFWSGALEPADVRFDWTDCDYLCRRLFGPGVVPESRRVKNYDTTKARKTNRRLQGRARKARNSVSP